MNFDRIYDERRVRFIGGRVTHIVASGLHDTARCGTSVKFAPVATRGRLCKRCQALEARAQDTAS